MEMVDTAASHPLDKSPRRLLCSPKANLVVLPAALALPDPADNPPVRAGSAADRRTVDNSEHQRS